MILANCHRNDKSDWYVVEGVHEPLVSPEIFEKAQKAIYENGKANGVWGRKKRTSNKCLLAGLIRCVNCGSTFYQAYCNVPSGKQKKKFYYYRDSGYMREGAGQKCKLTQVPMKPLHAWVLEQATIALCGDKNALDEAIEQFIQAVRAEEQSPVDTDGLKKKITKLTRRIESTVAMLADPDFENLTELKITLGKLKQQRDGLQRELSESTAANQPSISDDELRSFARGSVERISQIKPDKTAYDLATRNLLRMVVDRIEVDGTTKTGTLYLAGSLFDSYQKEFCSYAGCVSHQPVKLQSIGFCWGRGKVEKI